MTTWSIFSHDDLPPTPERTPSPPAGSFPTGLVPSAPPISPREVERIERQRAIAQAIRGGVGQVDGDAHRRMLTNRALLIEVGDERDVLPLLEEVEALGLQIERHPQ